MPFSLKSDYFATTFDLTVFQFALLSAIALAETSTPVLPRL